MNIKKINEELDKLLETQVEGGNPIIAIKDGSYEGDNIGEVVLNNLEEFTEDDIVNIMNNYQYYNNQGGHILFPSAWNYYHAGEVYPVKLAKALLKSQENELEGLSDLYNIFYRAHGDLDKFGEAAEVWEDNVKANIKGAVQELRSIDDDGSFAEDIFNELEYNYPELVASLRKEFFQ